MFKKILIVLMSLSILLVITYMMGPLESIQNLGGEYPAVPTRLHELEEYIHQKEDTVIGLKENNEARIIWADSLDKSKTPFSIVYLHGFGASQMEGDPVHRELAKHFGANLYLSRLPEHGIKRDNAFEYLSAKQLTAAARESYMIGKSLGDSVIVVGTSMGGALSILLASERPDMKALVLYSPCVKEYGDKLDAFFKPWQGTLMKKFMANEKGVLETPREGDKAKYWAEEYHVNAYSSLAILLRSCMQDSVFQKIEQPVFMAYYYKDEENQDKVVSVPAMLDMFEKTGTKTGSKVKLAFPESGDHVIGSSITSKDWEGVLESTISFLENTVGLKKYTPSVLQSHN